MDDADARAWYQQHLPEHALLLRVLDEGARWLRVREVLRLEWGAMPVPVYALELGSNARNAPVLGLFGGVHGIERIGTQVLLSWLQSTVQRLQWDHHWREVLQRVRVVVMPMVNPLGIALHRRSTPEGIDLMRNAPIDATEPVPWLVGGHRIAPWLPWYRGKAGAPMAAEAQALVHCVRQRVQSGPFSLTLDCHSGFGRRDRLWFPYARSRTPLHHLAEMHALSEQYEHTYPHHHPYLIEPQSASYTTHGDLWDYLYDDLCHRHPERIMLPLTLEMGSWLWVSKNPRQMLDYFGYFNPVISHRHRRVLRQHLPLIDFLLSATAHWQNWVPLPDQHQRHLEQGLRRWYPYHSGPPLA